MALVGATPLHNSPVRVRTPSVELRRPRNEGNRPQLLTLTKKKPAPESIPTVTPAQNPLAQILRDSSIRSVVVSTTPSRRLTGFLAPQSLAVQLARLLFMLYLVHICWVENPSFRSSPLRRVEATRESTSFDRVGITAVRSGVSPNGNATDPPTLRPVRSSVPRSCRLDGQNSPQRAKSSTRFCRRGEGVLMR